MNLNTIKIDPSVIAIPTLGGIITDLPLSADSEARFPASVQLPVTERAAADQRNWLVVDLCGHGVAMHITEARALGLTEAQNWIPDINGAPCVPDVGDLAGIEPRNADEVFIARINATDGLPTNEYEQYTAWLTAIGADLPEHEDGGVDWLEYMARYPQDRIAAALWQKWIA